MENGLSKEEIKSLIASALEARKNAYCPYSNFAVGAVVLTLEGEIYSGCNIENASYPAGNCAERTAIFKAVSEGVRELRAVAIVGGKMDEKISDYAYPCGICRQTMTEFAGKDFEIIVAIDQERYKVYKLKDLLPESFNKASL